MLEVTTSERAFLDQLSDFMASISVKNQIEADAYETADTAREASRYIYAMQGTDTFKEHTYSRAELIAVGILDVETINKSVKNPMYVPEEFHSSLLKRKRAQIIKDYVENNDYYRMLQGLPPTGFDPHLFKGKPVTEYTRIELAHFQLTKEFNDFVKENNQFRYLRHLGYNSIDTVTARTASNFDIIGYNSNIFDENLNRRFMELYYQVVEYTKAVTYSKAYEDNEFYHNFLALQMVFATAQKFITDKFQQSIRKDFYEEDDIRNMFYSYGLPFYDDIPLKYQRRIIRNINKLIKYKGTDQVLIDIVNLFGFENTELFRYYLIRDIAQKPENEFNKDDVFENFNIHFAQAPVKSQQLSKDLRDTAFHQKYEEVVGGDPFWGESEEYDFEVDEELKKKIREAEFNYVNTKYLAVNTVFNMSQSVAESTYFFQFINRLEHGKLIELMEFYASGIKVNNSKIKLFDAFTAIYYLMMQRLGFEDNIVRTGVQVASLYGFNFDGEYDEFIQFIRDRLQTTAPKGHASIYLRQTDEEILKILELPDPLISKRLLIENFFNNTRYRDMVRDEINKAPKYHQYKLLKAVHDYNLIAESISDLYTKPDGSQYESYSSYLKESDADLWNYVEVEEGESIESITRKLDYILTVTESYLNDPRFKYVFSGISTITVETVKKYLIRFINIFKAYTVEIRKINIFYMFDDKFMNTIRLFSEIHRMTVFKTEADNISEYLFEEMLIGLVKKSHDDELMKNVLEQIYAFTSKNLKDEAPLTDELGPILVRTRVAETVLKYFLEEIQYVKSSTLKENMKDIVEHIWALALKPIEDGLLEDYKTKLKGIALVNEGQFIDYQLEMIYKIEKDYKELLNLVELNHLEKTVTHVIDISANIRHLTEHFINSKVAERLVYFDDIKFKLDRLLNNTLELNEIFNIHLIKLGAKEVLETLQTIDVDRNITGYESVTKLEDELEFGEKTTSKNDSFGFKESLIIQ